jgi:hypothetical protein
MHRRNHLATITDLINEATRGRDEQVAAQIAVYSCEVARHVLEVGLKNTVGLYFNCLVGLN